MAQKYLFDTCFDGPHGAVSPAAAPRAPAPPPEPTFSRAELLAAEAKGHEDGHAAGLAEAAARQEEQIANSLAVIAASFTDMLARQLQTQHESERQAVELTRTIFAKLLPTLVKSGALAETLALVTSCMRECVDEPRLVLRVAEKQFDAAQRRIAPLAEGSGYPGKLIILADDALAGPDCRIEWADGGAERDLARTWREIDTALVRALGSIGAVPGPTHDIMQPAAPDRA